MHSARRRAALVVVGASQGPSRRLSSTRSRVLGALQCKRPTPRWSALIVAAPSAAQMPARVPVGVLALISGFRESNAFAVLSRHPALHLTQNVRISATQQHNTSPCLLRPVFPLRPRPRPCASRPCASAVSFCCGSGSSQPCRRWVCVRRTVQHICREMQGAAQRSRDSARGERRRGTPLAVPNRETSSAQQTSRATGARHAHCRPPAASAVRWQSGRL